MRTPSLSRLLFLILFILSLAQTKATAQNVRDCDSALAQDSEFVRNDDFIRTSWIQVMNIDTLDKLDTNFQTGLTYPVEGVPVTGHGNGAQIKESAKKQAEQSGWNYSRDRYIAYVHNYLSQNAASSYAKCLESLYLQNPGIHMRVKYLNERSVTIQVRWNAPYNSKAETAHVSLKGPKNATPAKKTWGPGNDEDDETFVLDQKEDFHYDIRVFGTSDSVFVPTLPQRIGKKQPPLYTEYNNRYPAWDPNFGPVCTGTIIPAGVKVRVIVRGVWSQANSDGVTAPYYRHNYDTVHPREPDWPTYISLNEVVSRKEILRSPPTYQKPEGIELSADQDYDVCVVLPKVESGYKFVISEPLLLDVVDTRLIK